MTIGRNAEGATQQDEGANAQIDLGPSKVVSRVHAQIAYSLNSRKWQLTVQGRNGLKVNGVRLTESPYALSSGDVLDVGGTQMMFVLPDKNPTIPGFLRAQLVPQQQQHSQHLQQQLQQQKQQHAPQVQTSILVAGQQPGQSEVATRDLSADEARNVKPQLSYATMITQAILSSPQGILALSDIYDYISEHYAYYRHTKQGWQNSIRHNLSLNKAFEKVPRKANEPGKGMKWQIAESYRKEFMDKWRDGSLARMKRGTSVARQLQQHLMKNNVLPQQNQQQQPAPVPSQPVQQIPVVHQPLQTIPDHQIPVQLPQVMIPQPTFQSPSPKKHQNHITANQLDLLTTPERTNKSILPQHATGGGAPNGVMSNNSSPALWNYVQFSTPLGVDRRSYGGGGNKEIGQNGGNQSDVEGSPLKGRQHNVNGVHQ